MPPILGPAPDSPPARTFDSTVIASLSGFVPTSLAVGAQVTLSSTSPALRTAVTNAAGATEPLGLLLTSNTDTTLANHFIRLASNDHTTLEWRPRLTVPTSNRPAPDVNPGTAPSAVVGANVVFGGSATNAISSAWSVVSGPGPAWVINPDTIRFSAPGVYQLRFAGVNVNGESSRNLSVTVTGTAITPIEVWRQTHFGNHLNSGPGLDTADNDADGVVSLLEYATAMNPAVNDKVPASIIKAANMLEFVYTRNKAATDVTCTVEWSENLAAWTIAGVPSSVVTDGATTQQIKALVPAGAIRRYVRLKVTRP